MTAAERQREYRKRVMERLEAARDLLGAIRRQAPDITKWPEFQAAERLLVGESN